MNPVKFFGNSRVHVKIPAEPGSVRLHFERAAVSLGIALVAFAVAGAMGDIHGTLREKLIGGVGGGVFVVAAVMAVRAAAFQVYEGVGARTGPSHAGILRWLVTIVGYVIILIAGFGLFDVPVGHLVLGGALTGVIVGIALQQALGNVFAGVVLLLARPFAVGDAIIVRNSSLNGPLEGTVSGMGMTYVNLLTDEGPLSIPNNAMLASAVGPLPGTGYRRRSRVDIETPQQLRELATESRESSAAVR